MVGPLFPSLNNKVDKDLVKGEFQQFLNGWILPLRHLSADEVIYFDSTFLNSFLIGKFVYCKQQLVGYYFTSKFKTKTNKAYLAGFMQSKAGTTKQCNRVFKDENLVILEYPNCGTLAISPCMNEALQVIVEEQ